MLATQLTRAACPKEFVSKEKEGRPKVFRDALKAAIRLIRNGQDVDTAVRSVAPVLQDGYKAEMFAFSWMSGYQVEDDLAQMHRALSYVFSEREEVLDIGVVCRISAQDWEDGQITAIADIILKRRNGLYDQRCRFTGTRPGHDKDGSIPTADNLFLLLRKCRHHIWFFLLN